MRDCLPAVVAVVTSLSSAVVAPAGICSDVAMRIGRCHGTKKSPPLSLPEGHVVLAVVSVVAAAASTVACGVGLGLGSGSGRHT